MPALARGFLATSHPDAILQLCTDSALCASEARNALDELFRTMADKEGGSGENLLLPSVGEQKVEKRLYIGKSNEK